MKNLSKTFAKYLQNRYKMNMLEEVAVYFWNYFNRANIIVLLGAQASQKNNSFRRYK